MFGIAMAALISTPTVNVSTAVPAPAEAVSAIVGEWEIVDGQSGEVKQACAKAQIFKASQDGRYIDLTERRVDNWSARYLVIHREANRVLMFIENEKRTTEQGDPILWWAYFDGPDQFRWRQYDWEATNATAAVWRRCRD